MDWIILSALVLAAGILIAVVVDSTAIDDEDEDPLPRGEPPGPAGSKTIPDRDPAPPTSPVVPLPACQGCCPVPAGTTFAATFPASLGVTLWAFAVLPEPLAWAGCLLGWVLITAAIFDLRYFWLPDALILPLIPAGWLVTWWMTGTFSNQAIGAVAGYAWLAAVRQLYWSMKGREGLGLGDAKLLAAAGAWVGWAGLPSVVLIAAVTALAM
jgi:leader peptidase (prepilin peptidase)/N-methyltransferase